MGLFDWIFGRRNPQALVLDRVWLKDKLLWQNLRREIDEELTAGLHVILVAHFPQRWDQLVNWLNAQELDFEDWQPRSWRDIRQNLASSAPRIWLLPVQDIPQYDPQLDEAGLELPVTVMASEHHPHPEGDRPLHELALGIPARGGIVFQVALDQPLFGSLGQLTALLQTLGMDTNECIDSPMVCKQIGRLQQRIARQVKTHGPADSAGEWMQRYANS
ncbi:MAG: hypothetical protein KDA90_14065 [Planctomycetaceae bacterium]|nr:hypothetical protein [Planctomycetaceae bacterium]